LARGWLQSGYSPVGVVRMTTDVAAPLAKQDQ
jgi:hypothetical protein